MSVGNIRRLVATKIQEQDASGYFYRLVATQLQKKKQESTFLRLHRSLPNKWVRKGESEDQRRKVHFFPSPMVPSASCWLTISLASDSFAAKVQYGGG